MPDKRIKLESLFAIGRIFSPFYGWAMLVRAWMYKRGWLKSASLIMPVLSVGNLTMGGTGKTPMVMYMARFLLKHGWHPAIISRGYGGSSKGAINIVSDGHGVKMEADVAGDEPVLLARSIPGVPVVTGAKRSVTGRYVEDKEMADVLIMDDGFQHMALRRDLNIVLFAGNSPLGNGRVFPGGDLREPFSALSRADCFVLTGIDADNKQQVEAFAARLGREFSQKPLFYGKYLPSSLFCVGDDGDYNLSELNDATLLSFCGIANPDSFTATLQDMYTVKKSYSFADHYAYTAKDVELLVAEAKKMDCNAIITTEKDYVKLKKNDFDFPLWVLKVELKLPKQFDDFLLSRLS